MKKAQATNKFVYHFEEIRSYFSDRYNISDPDYKLIETVILESRPYKAGPQWKFSGAFYFSVVVVALIGMSMFDVNSLRCTTLLLKHRLRPFYSGNS